METVMNEFNDPNDKLWSKFFGYKPYSHILLEDLKVDHFKLANRRNCLDAEHGMLVMRSLGRFHGISHYLLSKGLLTKDDLDKNFMQSESPFTRRLVQGGLKQLACVMQQHWAPEWKEIAHKLSKESEIIHEKIRKIYSSFPENGFLVMIHGDCWTSNIMFKYNQENIPTAVKFLDFQGSNFNSCLIDVVYFLYISIIPEIRRVNIDKFLTEYHISLMETLDFYGISKQAPKIEDLYNEFKRLQYLACFYNLVIFAVGSAETNSALYFDKLATDCDCKDCYNPEIFMSEKYKSAVAEDLENWAKEGVI